jgi:hypothetical protein
MALLQAALGAFEGLMEGPELETALNEVKRLHDLNIQEKIRSFGEIYPKAERPWEKPTGDPMELR